MTFEDWYRVKWETTIWPEEMVLKDILEEAFEAGFQAGWEDNDIVTQTTSAANRGRE